jgi:hypothetical protein
MAAIGAAREAAARVTERLRDQPLHQRRLTDMANRLRIAVVAVTHLNKGGAGHQNAPNRFAGSIAFVAAARSAFAVIEDSEDETRRLLLQAKNNLGPKCKGLAFRIEQRLIAGDKGRGRRSSPFSARMSKA